MKCVAYKSNNMNTPLDDMKAKYDYLSKSIDIENIKNMLCMCSDYEKINKNITDEDLKKAGKRRRVVLITGASSGIGEKSALALLDKGFIVYGAARRKNKLKELEAKGVKTIILDVTDDKSMIDCVDYIIKKEGRLDVLVNNAGYGSYGAVEDVDMEEARRQIEVNLFGLARMTQLVLPHMRKRKYGRIINIASMGGRIWTPFGAWYHATKFAVEGFSASLRLEVKPFGIDVVVVEPGGIKTEWGIIAADNLEKVTLKGAYKETGIKTAENMRRVYSEDGLTKPEVIGNCVAKAVTAKRPKTRYLLGFGAKPAAYTQKIFGDRVYDKLISTMYGL